MAGGRANAQTGEDYTLIAEVVDANALEASIKDAAFRMSVLQVNEALLKKRATARSGRGDEHVRQNTSTRSVQSGARTV